MHMAFGIPEEVGLRCPYHGWLFDGTGRCLEQPLAPPDSTFKDRVRIAAYQVQEMGGLVWAYLGPEPVPLLPRLDLCEREHELRQIVGHMLPCNWLQVMENRGDQRGIYLHGRLLGTHPQAAGRLTDDPSARYNATMHQQADRMQRGAYPSCRSSPISTALPRACATPTLRKMCGSWAASLLPYLVYPNGGNSGSIRHDYQIGVPIDDTTTWHISYRSYTSHRK